MKWLWVVLAVVLLALGAFGLYKFAKKTMAPQAVAPANSSSPFASIQDALSKQLSLQCNFSSDNGVGTVAYIKMGAVHVDTDAGKSDAMSMIMKDKKIYFWQVGSKNGTMMSVPSITVTPVPTSGTQPTGAANQGSSMMANLEKFKDSCKVATVPDSLFVVPTDVKFVDMSQMMPVVPSGVPSGANSQQYQQMMQQYRPTGY